MCRAANGGARKPALEEPLLDDYVHVTASGGEEEELNPQHGATDSTERQGAAGLAGQAEGRGRLRRGRGAAALPAVHAGLGQQLSRLWRRVVTACLRAACRCWNSLRELMSWCWSALGISPPPPQLSLIQRDRLESLQDRVAVPYDADSPSHQAALVALWEAAFPGENFPQGTKSERWKDMGWQSDDPGRDFRAGGFVSLESLLYLAQREEPTFRRLMGKVDGQRSEWEYPFAAGGVNLAYMLTDVLDLRRPGKLPATAAGRSFVRLLLETDTAFEEVFVAAYVLLDKRWLEMRATYMEFPQVLK
ncbi:hypothetical protein N2152v2_008122 [Parachlorella kessleri]